MGQQSRDLWKTPLDVRAYRLWTSVWPVWRPCAVADLWSVAIAARVRKPAAVASKAKNEIERFSNALGAMGRPVSMSCLVRAIAVSRGWIIAEPVEQRRKDILLLAALSAAQRPEGVRIAVSYARNLERTQAEMAPCFDRIGLSLVEMGPQGEVPDAPNDRAVISSLRNLCNTSLRDQIQLGEPASGLRLATRDLRGKVPSPRPWAPAPSVLVMDADRGLLDDAATALSAGGALGDLFTATEARSAIQIAQKLDVERDYKADPSRKALGLTALGRQRLAEMKAAGGLQGLPEDEARRNYLVVLALTVFSELERDRDYIVENQKVVLINPETRQPEPGRNWGSGVRQMVEVREGLRMSQVQRTMAQMSIPAALGHFSSIGGTAVAFEGAGRELHRQYHAPVWPGTAPRNPGKIHVFPTDQKRDLLLADLASNGAILISDSGGLDGAIGVESALAGQGGIQERLDQHSEPLLVLCEVPFSPRIPVALSQLNAGAEVRQYLSLEDPFLGAGVRIFVLRKCWNFLPFRQYLSRRIIEFHQGKMASKSAGIRHNVVDVESRRKRLLAFAGQIGK